MIVLTILAFMVTIIATGMLPDERWTRLAGIVYLFYVVWWLYLIAFVSFRSIIKYLNYIHISWLFVAVYVLVRLILSKLTDAYFERRRENKQEMDHVRWKRAFERAKAIQSSKKVSFIVSCKYSHRIEE